jgi:chloramphenicol 3-O-phosphotransferase
MMRFIVHERHAEALRQLPGIEWFWQRHAHLSSARPLRVDRPARPPLELSRRLV